MSEIEKMYENAGIDNYRLENFCGLVPKGYTTIDDKEKKGYVKVVRDFSPEKQLELIKWLIREKYLIGRYIESYYELFTNSMISYNSKNECFEKSLAGLINNLWQDLTEEEKQEIKRILEWHTLK